MKEATAGWGTNDRKLIVSLCSRNDILDKNGGSASFEQFKEIAWKASVKSAVPSQSPLRAPPPEVQDRASHFVRSDSGNWKA